MEHKPFLYAQPVGVDVSYRHDMQSIGQQSLTVTVLCIILRDALLAVLTLPVIRLRLGASSWSCEKLVLAYPAVRG